MKTDLDYAKEIWNERSNGSCEGMSSDKGGRAWLSGEFQLEELEALCIILRDVAGDKAQTFQMAKERTISYENEVQNDHFGRSETASGNDH